MIKDYIGRGTHPFERTLPRVVEVKRTKCARRCDAVIVTYDDDSSMVTCPICLDCFRHNECRL